MVFPFKTFALILLAVCAGFILQQVLPYNSLGIVPRDWSFGSLYGIFMSWTMHSNWQHISGNMLAFVPLLAMFLYSEKQHAIRHLIVLAAGGGALTWLIGSHAVHVGASGLIFALTGFILVSAITRKKWLYLIFVFIMAGEMMYSIKTGLNPMGAYSFAGHLSGFVVGLTYAWYLSRNKKKHLNNAKHIITGSAL